jgi:hypothetical protein
MSWGKYFIYVGLFVILAAGGSVVYWVYAPSQVLQVHNGPVPVRPQTQRADDLVFLIVNYCKLRNIPGTVRRYLVSSTVRIPLPLQTDTGPVACTQADVPLLVPKGVEPDTYHVHIDVDYQVNPLKMVTERIDSQPFTVQ